MRFRDVNSVSLSEFYTPYSQSAIAESLTAVQSVEVTVDNSTMQASGDTAISQLYTGVTGVGATVTIEMMDYTTEAVTPAVYGGDIEWYVPAACQAGSATWPEIKVSVANCVCTEKRVSVEHQGFTTTTLTFRAYSSDGTTSPINITYRDTVTSTASENAVGDDAFYRDIYTPQFTPQGGSATEINEVRSIEWTISGTAQEDSAEDDIWLTCIFVTDLSVEVTITHRDMNQTLEDSEGTDNLFYPGVGGSLTFEILNTQTVSGLTDTTDSVAVTLSRLVCTNINPTNPHGDFTEVTTTFTGHGAQGSLPAATYV